MDGINLKKLAERLNLSVSTVSKAFRNSYDISPETRDRILAMARELNYQPNPYASGLRTQKSRTIAVIIPEIANNYFTQAINGIESIAQQKEYHVLIYLTHEDHGREQAFAQHLQSGRVEGILISLSDGSKDRSHIDLLFDKGIPLVFFDRIDDQVKTTRVTTNDYESGYAATKHLIDQGCKSIAHLSFSKNLSIGNERKKGYLAAMKDHELPVKKELVISCDQDNGENFKKIRRMLESKYRPDGIFSAFEKLAITTYEVCEALPLSIPGELKIISFSNMETAALLNPSLSTITQPAFDIGRQAAIVLFQALENQGASIPDQHIVIPAKLVKRKSSS